ncbi:MAG: PadR family transcriptional regulator [Pirellulales bacterium]|nr:PadR family transcriptional regulator [Pirellulales bacterium]
MVSFLNCPCSGVTLDKLIQPAILAVLSEQPAHGYRIAERIGQMPNFAEHKPDVSGVYKTLKSMDAKGLVVSSWDTPGTGHAKRLYKIAPAGRTCLARWVETLDDYLAAVAAVLKIARKAATKSSPKRPGQPRKRAKRPASAR